MIFSSIIKTLCITSFALFGLCAALSTNAQVDTVSNDIQVELSPSYPGPGELVTARASSFSFDMNSTPVTWVVNGRQIASGIAKTSITFTTGNIGAPTILEVRATPAADSKKYEKTTTIYPSFLDLVWHTNSYTPPWYRGKALPARGSTVIITALPSFVSGGSATNPSSLIYDWWLDNKLLKSESGRGKSIFAFQIASNENIVHSVRARVTNTAGTITQEKTIRIRVHKPVVQFYELDALRGPVSQRAITNSYDLGAGTEIQILAVPYFVSAPPSFFTHSWVVGGSKLPPDTSNSSILTYRSEPASSALQTISLTLQNTAWVLEQARGSFQIQVK